MNHPQQKRMVKVGRLLPAVHLEENVFGFLRFCDTIQYFEKQHHRLIGLGIRNQQKENSS
jgi:hypothetical protein